MFRKLAAVLVPAACLILGCTATVWSQQTAASGEKPVELTARPWGAPAPEEKKSAADQIRRAWMDLHNATFNKAHDACEFEYGPQGMKNIFCYVSSVTAYRTLAAWSGMKPFLEGPHSADKLDTRSRFTFGHYNPAFVRWMRDNLIPGADDDEFRWVVEPIYNRYFRDTARMYLLVYLKLQRDQGYVVREAAALVQKMENKTLNEYYPWEYSDFIGDQEIRRHFAGDFYWGNVTGCAVAFWLRRHIDGTDGEFFKGLKKLMLAHDPTFFEAAVNVAPVKPQARKLGERVRLRTNDNILVKFLDGLTSAVEQHEWDLVLTMFAPENYRAQLEIGIGPIQYMIEGLGLGMVDNHLIPLPGDGSAYAKLNAIQAVELTKLLPADSSGLLTVKGRVTLFDGSRRNVEIYLRKTRTGAYMIEPAVG